MTSEANFAESRAAWHRVRGVLKPPAPLTISEWADRHRVLGPSSPMPGPWRTSVAPFLREIQDALSPDSGVELTVVMKPVQVGATEVLLNCAGYYLAHAPATVMVVEPNEDMAKRLSRQRVEPLIELCAPLKALIAKARSKGGNEAFLKTTRTGGTLVIASARSAASLRSLPARIVLCDETDSYLGDLGEGNPFDLAAARATTFGALKRIAAISTPTEAGLSLIETLFGETDQRRWFAPCPLCGFEQILAWGNLRWEPKEPETARYHCAACNRAWDEARKRDTIAAGRWKPTAKGKTNERVRGYQFSALISPWQRWAELAAQYEAATTPERKKTFTNLVLGEPWQGEQQTPLDADLLMQRREVYAAEVPMSACMLTCGVDTQDDRLELEIVGWGRDEENWSVGYFILEGDPAQPDIWAELDALLTREYRHESGFKLTIAAACIDSGGHHSAAVYEFCRTRFGRKVWAAKGASGFTRPIFPRRPSKGFTKAPLQLLGVDSAKEKVYSRLRVDATGAGFCHFPLSYHREYFAQLTSERLTVRYSAGRPERVWIKPRDVRNEALDTRVLALAALHGLYQHGIRLGELADQFERMQMPHSDRRPSVIRSKYFYGDGD